MAKPIAVLPNDIKNFASDIRENTNRLKKARALLIDRGLILATPVDTGRARANWNVSISISNRNVTMSDSYQSPQLKLDSDETIIKSAKLGDVIYLTNALPYIARLNEGFSPQASAGFIQNVVMTAEYAKIKL